MLVYPGLKSEVRNMNKSFIRTIEDRIKIKKEIWLVTDVGYTGQKKGGRAIRGLKG